MLKQISFKQDLRCFKLGDEISFKEGVSLIVGDQGTGKSTLLSLLMGRMRKDVLSIKCPTKMSTYSFDFEKDNPRTKKHLKTTEQIVCHFASHGQSINALLKEIVHFSMEDNVLILLDEPDMALSIRSIYKLIDLLKKAEENGAQIISSAHNPILIEAFEEVYSLEHRKWMLSSDFIENQKLIN